ncbi:hypothetical protein AEAC466_04590 [Asticcacaulis sp. AC466]|uniref:hypothetical protein n=1 Tax=Asticcacaulis sp. AC466 TaxID=1282362 RepID=UPI0003C3ACAB|nr:hypothetical protein [Asticcacaulis sp. AC466]ESQ85447.1 hypothetical protein AEAC466_04590 [Asticcacaulis sp. AC466]
MARELAIEGDVVEWAEDNGWIVRKMSYIGRRGAADRFFFGYGQIVLIEFKKRNGALSVQQARERQRLAAVGVTVHRVDTVAEGIAILEGVMLLAA